MTKKIAKLIQLKKIKYTIKKKLGGIIMSFVTILSLNHFFLYVNY